MLWLLLGGSRRGGRREGVGRGEGGGYCGSLYGGAIEDGTGAAFVIGKGRR